MKNGYILVSFLVISPALLAADDLPYREQPASEVCAGLRYIHPSDMKVRLGTKNCLADVAAFQCQSSGDSDCLVMAPLKAVAKTEIDPGIIRAGKNVLGVTGTVDETYHNPQCSHELQHDCQVNLPYRAVAASAVIPGNFKDGVAVFGFTGSYSDPDPVIDCSLSLDQGCFVTGRFIAVAKAELLPEHIKNTELIGNVAGQYPSASFPLESANPGLAKLTSANFATKLASSATFRFYDGHGGEHTATGSASLRPENIAAGQSLFGVVGTAQPMTTLDFAKVRYRDDLYSGQGSLKMDCRNAFAHAHNLVSSFPTIDDASNIAATNYKWGEGTRCNDELWQNVTTDTGGNLVACTNSDPVCEYRNIVTGLTWRKDPHKTEHTRDEAAQKCADIVVTDGKPWRLPTHRELQQAYVHRIRYIAPGAGFLDAAKNYWTSSSRPASDPTINFSSTYVNLGSGVNNGFTTATEKLNYLCVK